MMRDIDKAIRLINDWNHDKEPATHGHAVWVGLKLIHEIERLRAEVDALRVIISQCAAAVGAGVSTTCSLEFLSQVPSEIKAAISKILTEK